MNYNDPFGTEIITLRNRLSEALEALEAIRSGDVDAVVVYQQGQERVYTLEGADQPYRIMLEEINEGAATLSEDGIVLWGNKCLAGLLGRPLDQVLGASLAAFMSEETAARWQVFLRDNDAETARLEVDLTLPHGEVKPALLSITSLAVRDHPASLCLIVTDLTEQKKSLQIAAAEQLASAIIEQAAEPVVVCDLTGMIVRANKAAAILASRDPIGQPFEHVYPLNFSAEHPAAAETFTISSLLTGESYQGLEACLAHPSGVEMSLLVSARPLTLADSEPAGVVISLVDLTTRKQAEEELRLSEQALRQSESRFRIALAHTPITVFTMDTELRYTWVYFGQQGKTMPRQIGLRINEVPGTTDVADIIRIKQEVLNTGRHFRGEVRITRGGKPRILILTLEPLRNEEGQIIGLTGAEMDITDQRRMEAAELEYKARLEVQRSLLKHREAERVKVARELHDTVLQELIVANMGVAEIMRINDSTAREEKLRWVQGMVQKQVSEIRQFCRELRPPTLAPFGLHKAIESHVDSLRQMNPDLLVDLNLMRESDKFSEETRLELFRIYQELVNNVIRHAKAEHLVVTLEANENSLLLELWDDGLGFDVPTDWVAQARTGHLGLIGIRERAEQLGAQFTIQSMPQGGTRARLTMPYGEFFSTVFSPLPGQT